MEEELINKAKEIQKQRDRVGTLLDELDKAIAKLSLPQSSHCRINISVTHVNEFSVELPPILVAQMLQTLRIRKLEELRTLNTKLQTL